MNRRDLDLTSFRTTSRNKLRSAKSPQPPSLSPCAISTGTVTPSETSPPQTQDGIQGGQQSPAPSPAAPPLLAAQPSPTPPPQLTTDPPTHGCVATPSPQKSDRSTSRGQTPRSVWQSGVQKRSAERRVANEQEFEQATKAALRAVITDYYALQLCSSQWHQEDKFNEVVRRVRGWLDWQGLTREDFLQPGEDQ